jgi:carboxymethylenebutenolidase
MNSQDGTALTPDQQAMSDLWDEHMRSEFETSSVDDTLATMVEEPYVNHAPVMTGGVGLEEVRKFYAERFIPQQPPETEITPISRTIGNDRVVDELVYAFTHDIQMDWLLPGVPPTGRHIEVIMVVVVAFRDGKIESEHIYWDQATVLVQAGLIDPDGLPVSGVESTRKVIEPTSVPSNGLMGRSEYGSAGPDTDPTQRKPALRLPLDSRSPLSR